MVKFLYHNILSCNDPQFSYLSKAGGPNVYDVVLFHLIFIIISFIYDIPEYNKVLIILSISFLVYIGFHVDGGRCVFWITNLVWMV